MAEAAGGQPALLADRLGFTWPTGHRALNHCSFSIPRPGLWMLVGGNGCGKSTLLRLIAGLLEPSEGQLQRPLKPALVFQNPDHQLLLPSCGSELAFHLPEETALSTVVIDQALKQVGLEGMADRPIHSLSGGQKQRLAIASGLLSGAQLLLLDEPTALLDPESQQSVLQLIRQLSPPLTALWVTHRLEELEQCDGALQLECGVAGPWQSGAELRRQLERQGLPGSAAGR